MISGPIPVLALASALVTTAIAHICYKRYSINHRRRDLLITIVLFGITPPLTYVAVKSLGVGLVYVCTSINYVAAAMAGKFLFSERLSRRSIVAMSLICCGTLIYALGLPT